MFKRFSAGVAVGYVLGARAGQKRYEQITELAQRALEIPAVERLADSGRELAKDQGQQALTRLKEWFQFAGGGEQDDDEEDSASGDDDVEGGFEQDDADEAPDGDQDPDGEVDDDVWGGEEEASDDNGSGADDEDVQGVDASDEEDGQERGGHRPPDRRERRPSGKEGPRRTRGRGRVGSLAAAARERGRVA